MRGLKDAEDAFGHLVQDYLNGERGVEVVEVVERDDGFVGTSGSVEQYFAPYEEWPPHCREAMRFVRGRVLDIGCGAGRHALYLQGQGFDVVGVDVSPLAVAVCRRRGLKHVQVASIAHPDARLGTFDTLLLLGANLGLLGSATRAKELLRRFHGMTSAAARIIAESRDPATIADPVHAAYQEANRQRNRLPGQIRMRVRHRRYATPWFDYLFVSPQEMAQLLDGTGWRVGEVLGGGEEGYVAIIEKAQA